MGQQGLEEVMIPRNTDRHVRYAGRDGLPVCHGSDGDTEVLDRVYLLPDLHFGGHLPRELFLRHATKSQQGSSHASMSGDFLTLFDVLPSHILNDMSAQTVASTRMSVATVPYIKTLSTYLSEYQRSPTDKAHRVFPAH